MGYERLLVRGRTVVLLFVSFGLVPGLVLGEGPVLVSCGRRSWRAVVSIVIKGRLEEGSKESIGAEPLVCSGSLFEVVPWTPPVHTVAVSAFPSTCSLIMNH